MTALLTLNHLGEAVQDDEEHELVSPQESQQAAQIRSLIQVNQEQSRQIASLVSSVTAQSESVRIMSTSWLDRSTDLIKTVEVIERKVDGIVNVQHNMEEKLNHVEQVIDGNDRDQPLDRRIHSLEMEQTHQKSELRTIRDKDLKEIKDERKRMYWLFFGALAALVTGIVIEVVKYVAFVAEKR
jgi:hypothetical protein